MLQVAKRELALECDYSYEARSQKKFRELVMADTDFALHVRVPDVVSELCTPRLLTTEWVPGVHIDKAGSQSCSHDAHLFMLGLPLVGQACQCTSPPRCARNSAGAWCAHSDTSGTPHSTFSRY